MGSIVEPYSTTENSNAPAPGETPWACLKTKRRGASFSISRNIPYMTAPASAPSCSARAVRCAAAGAAIRNPRTPGRSLRSTPDAALVWTNAVTALRPARAALSCPRRKTARPLIARNAKAAISPAHRPVPLRACWCTAPNRAWMKCWQRWNRTRFSMPVPGAA